MGSSITTCRWRNQGTRKLTKSVYQRLNTAESSWHHSQRALAEICHLLPAHPSGSCSGPCFQGWVLEAEATVLVMMLCHVLTHGRCVCSVEAKRQQGDLCSQPCPGTQYALVPAVMSQRADRIPGGARRRRRESRKQALPAHVG